MEILILRSRPRIAAPEILGRGPVTHILQTLPVTGAQAASAVFICTPLFQDKHHGLSPNPRFVTPCPPLVCDFRSLICLVRFQLLIYSFAHFLVFFLSGNPASLSLGRGGRGRRRFTKVYKILGQHQCNVLKIILQAFWETVCSDAPVRELLSQTMVVEPSCRVLT